MEFSPERRNFLTQSRENLTKAVVVAAAAVIPFEAAEAQQETPEQRFERVASGYSKYAMTVNFSYNLDMQKWESLKPKGDGPVTGFSPEAKAAAEQIISNLFEYAKHLRTIYRGVEKEMQRWADAKGIDLEKERVKANPDASLQALIGTQIFADTHQDVLGTKLREIEQWVK